MERSAVPVLAFALVFPSLIWIKTDRRFWPWDQAWYGEVAVELYHTLIHEPTTWFHAMRVLLPLRPPLIAWLGQLFIPVGIAIGDIDFALLLMVVLTQGLTLCVVWLAASKISSNNGWLASMAMLMVASAPLFVGMSHQYLTEPLQTLIVAASFYLALVAARIPSFRLTMLLGLSIAMGFAIKPTTIAYCGLAWTIVSLVVVRRVFINRALEFEAPADLILLATFIGALALTGAWYVTNAVAMLTHIRVSTTGETAELWGHSGTLLSKLSYWVLAINDALFLRPYVFVSCLLIVAAALMFSLLGARRKTTNRSTSRFAMPDAVAGAAIAHIVFVLLLLSGQINEDSRFVMPLLPPLAIAVVWGVRKLGMRRLAIPLTALAFAQLVLVHLEAHGLVRRLSNSPWLLPVSLMVKDREVAKAIESMTCRRELSNRYNVVGVEYPTMNALSMHYESAKARFTRGYRCNYIELGFAETNPDGATQWIERMKAAFVILPREDKLPISDDLLNAVTPAVFDFINRSDRYIRGRQDFGDYQLYQRID